MAELPEVLASLLPKEDHTMPLSTTQDVPARVQAVIAEHLVIDPYAVAETLAEEDVSRGEIDPDSPELDLAFTVYSAEAARQLLAAEHEGRAEA